MIEEFMKRVCSYLLLGCILFAGVESASAQSTLDAVKGRGALIAGVRFDTPPYGSLDASGKSVGIDIDIASEVAKRLGVRLQLLQVTGQTRIPQLNAGKVDLLLAALTRTPEREKAVDYTMIYFMDDIRMLVRKGSNIRVPADLSGKNVTTVQGSTNVPILKREVPDAKVQLFPEYPQAFLALRQGLADAMVTNGVILDQFVKADSNFEVVGSFGAPEYIGIGVRKDDPAWRKALNDILRDMVKDGTWDRIVKSHVSIEVPRPELPTQ